MHKNKLYIISRNKKSRRGLPLSKFTIPFNHIITIRKPHTYIIQLLNALTKKEMIHKQENKKYAYRLLSIVSVLIILLFIFVNVLIDH